MSVLDKFKVDEKQNHNWPIAKTRGNLNLSYKQITDASQIMRDELEQEYPGKYEMAELVKTSIGWRSGKFAPTDQQYIYVYSLNIYDNVNEKNKQYLDDGLVYDEIHFVIREKKKLKKNRRKKIDKSKTLL